MGWGQLCRLAVHQNVHPLSLDTTDKLSQNHKWHCQNAGFQESQFFPNVWKWKLLSRVQLFATPWTIYSPWNSPDQNTGVVVAFPFSRGSSQPMCQTQVSHTAGGFLTSWATGKSKNTGVGSLLLLQRIFLTQESNQCLQHCRLILHQLSYQATTFLTWGHNNAIMPPKKLANSYTCFY